MFCLFFVCIVVFFFFFQAEDGIRDWSVTGVQTCALPIYQCIAYTALDQNETALDICNDALRLDGDWGRRSPALAWRYRGNILDRKSVV